MKRQRLIEYSVDKEHSGVKISRFLRDKGYPESALTRLRKEDGLIRLNGESVHMNHKLTGGGEVLTVCIVEEESSQKIVPVFLHIDILYEDDDLMVVSKPPFMPIHPSLNNYDNSLANALAYYYKEKNEPFVFRCMNRLDRDTSGITILAKHYLAAGILSEAVKNRDVKREYFAIVTADDSGACKKLPATGTIDRPIARKEGSTIERVVDSQGERAVTHYEVIDRGTYISEKGIKDIFLVKCLLETGRTHQIRVHFKSLGYPLAGDFLYNPENEMLNRQALHAGYISFFHPITGAQMDFAVPLPDDMRSLFYGICN